MREIKGENNGGERAPGDRRSRITTQLHQIKMTRREKSSVNENSKFYGVHSLANRLGEDTGDLNSSFASLSKLSGKYIY